MKISIPTGTHSSARDTRGVSIDASSTRFVRKRGGGLPVSAQSINVLRLSILFPSVFVLRPACHPTRAASASALPLRCPRPPSPSPPFALVARPRVPVIPVRSPYFVLITSHRQPGRARLSALPRDNAAQLLIALPISARARSRSTSPAAGLQTNACPIINCHDPLIGWGYASLRRPRTFLAYFFRARKDTRLFTTDLFPIFDALVRRNFTREFRSIDRIIAFFPSLLRNRFFLCAFLSSHPSSSYVIYVAAISLIPRESLLIRSW